jgi:hypothetical protein
MWLTSDGAPFHRITGNLAKVLEEYARKAGTAVSLSHAHSILLVAHPDNTGELWVDAAAVSLQVVIRREMQAGTVVFERDIGDVTGLSFPMVPIQPNDRVLYLFREGWRFGLFFDLAGIESVEDLSRRLGRLFRELRYRHLYDLVANQPLFERLVAAGWFPFVEIIADGFQALLSSAEVGFDLADAEAKLLASFDDGRLDRLLTRWLVKPHFKAKEAILKSAVDAYRRGDSIAVLKIVLTEIEGILSDAHLASTGKRAKLKALLKFASASAEAKVGASDSLMFSSAFGTYLEKYTFANFDPLSGPGNAGSRHAVGHGAADPTTYTQTRALQALLVLDQLALYT